ncbi:MAG: hypothetical protein D8M59_11845 [Planctomycetes bacterium]|nr:hypothetical protein [Planctomycetota bacterium]
MLTGATATTLALAGDCPEDLDRIAMGTSKRTVHETTINGMSFEYITVFSDLPYIAWPTAGQEKELPTTDNPQATGKWLARAAGPLGFDGFVPKYLESFRWYDNDVWVYTLQRNGMELHDARVMVHRRDGIFQGIHNHMDGRIRSITDPTRQQLDSAKPNIEYLYYPKRVADGLYDVIPATLMRTSQEGGITEIVRFGDGNGEQEITRFPIEEHLAQQVPARFTEYNVPVGSFPDQISVAEDGLVWFSQPNNNYITSLDPDTGVFTQYDTTVGGGSGADGLIVGTNGRVWAGMYYTGSLGMLDTNTGIYHDYPGNYGVANMAIPVETSDGHVWVTDHQYNRISEFDPATNSWIQSLVMPTPACWVVQGYEDRDHGEVYYTEYNVNKLGRCAVGGNTVTDIVVGGGGPAFCVYSNGCVYYSRWLESGIGEYNVTTGVVTEYDFPVANEWGGPMWIRPNGDIVTGTRGRGYIMIFHLAGKRFTYHQIPTAYPGLKDGLTVSDDNVIWFTESGTNKVTKLDFHWR